jgi:hypothetical protein
MSEKCLLEIRLAFGLFLVLMHDHDIRLNFDFFPNSIVKTESGPVIAFCKRIKFAIVAANRCSSSTPQLKGDFMQKFWLPVVVLFLMGLNATHSFSQSEPPSFPEGEHLPEEEFPGEEDFPGEEELPGEGMTEEEIYIIEVTFGQNLPEFLEDALLEIRDVEERRDELLAQKNAIHSEYNFIRLELSDIFDAWHTYRNHDLVGVMFVGDRVDAMDTQQDLENDYSRAETSARVKYLGSNSPIQLAHHFLQVAIEDYDFGFEPGVELALEAMDAALENANQELDEMENALDDMDSAVSSLEDLRNTIFPFEFDLFPSLTYQLRDFFF